MTEWHDSEVAAYDLGNQYEKLSNEKVQQLAGCLDATFNNYIRGAGDTSELRYGTDTNNEKQLKMMIEYSDVSFNAYHQGVVTSTHFTLVRTNSTVGVAEEIYDVAIERQVVVDGAAHQAINENEHHDAFTEYYCIEKFPAGMYRAYVGRLNQATREGEVEYEDMRLYDVQYLIAELDKIAGLYDAGRRDHATIE